MADTIGVLDYIIIVLSLCISTAIGVYFAASGGRQKTSTEYFLGDRKMSALPISASIVVSVMSAIAYLGTPAEIYMTGPKYALYVVGRLLSIGLVCVIFLPVFYRMHFTSVYEYLDKRFNKLIRYSVIICTCLHSFLYLGIVLYTPALALSTVTGLRLSGSILAIGIVCTFYTTIGGFKAVIWTDVFQAIVMTLSLFVMIIVGSVKAGGPSLGWQHAVYGQRSELVDFSVNPTITYTFWSLTIGSTVFNVLIFGLGQSFVQRFMSCKTEGQAKLAVFLGVTGTSIIDLLGVAMGMVLYSLYVYCDPLSNGDIANADQILPYFIMDVFGQIPGMAGLLIAGAFCASLSSVSSLINSLAAITGEDFVKVLRPNISETQYTLAIKICSACYGMFGIVIAFLASVMGRVLATAISVAGILHGPGLGVFLLGVLCPRAHSKGTFCGFLVGICIGLIFFIGNEIKSTSSTGLPLYTHGCEDMSNTTSFFTELPPEYITEFQTDLPANNFDQESSNFFALSFMYYAVVTSIPTVIIGYLCSILIPGHDPSSVDPMHISPFMFKYFPCCLPNGMKHERPRDTEMADVNLNSKNDEIF